MPIISASAASQSVQVVQSAIAASNTTYTSGLVTITGVGGGVTVSSNTGQRIDISVAAQSVQVVQSAIAASNTTYTSGLVTITGVGGGVTVSSNTGQRIDISVAAQSVQIVQSAIAASNTTYTSGLVTFTGVGGGVTVQSNTGQRVDISVAAQSVQVVQSAIAASNTTYTSGLVVLTGSNMVTVKSSGAGQTVIIDATQTVQTQNLIDVTLAGNTSGALALVSSGTLTLAGGNNITLSQAGNAITISAAAAGGAQTAISGIVASNTTYTSGTVVFSASDSLRSAISVASVGAQSVIVSDAGPQLAHWNRGWPGAVGQSQMAYGSVMTLFPLMPEYGNRFPGRMTANIFRVFMSHVQNQSASISAQLSSTMNIFIYSRSSDSLSLINSGSATYGNTVATSNNNSGWTGIRYHDITATSAWSVSPDFLYGGEYHIGIRLDTHITTGTSRASFINIAFPSGGIVPPLAFGTSAAGGNRQWRPFLGIINLSATNDIRTTIVRSEVSGFHPSTNNMIFDPYIQMFETTHLAS